MVELKGNWNGSGKYMCKRKSKIALPLVRDSEIYHEVLFRSLPDPAPAKCV